ncbi:MAG TPA: biotin--[acetyl-CoA-carboxylase] ligase [Stackebrandtia sp.]|jgi:BirA family biotin operon repressor/biotin-[acetyl-CoA-carboxylase] ligase|uniref:biotin--[acetyl-CoA-carboxylase] ligase n=1 Tax=Stackebrandtia sp. TaxID=2023065 RepID=UPI002D5264F8|nr:biotin--[acetyl-CoA-carboxylase] ligase [Stackebrandtia sp.]HZE41879.1 biotin--[acetyl-CoA-carboxylase] ligase [Stackebrandtia sp.]
MDRAPLDADWLRQWCRRSRMWASVEVLDSVGSTNTLLSQRAIAGVPPGTVIAAEQQTAGRGRAERSWVSPPRAGLAVSMLLRPTVPALRWSWLPLLAGVATSQTIAELCGVTAALKWPNDVLVGPEHRKCAGILSEVAAGSVVVGIGLNVSLRREELPRPDTTSLELEGAVAVDRARLLAALLDRIARWYTTWEATQGDPVASGLAEGYRLRCHTLGRQVTVSLPDGGSLDGQALAIDNDGRLRVNTEDGHISVAAGDIQHVR